MENKIKSIQVLGSGCPSCKKLYELTKEAVVEMGIATAVEYSSDVQKIIAMGVMQSPVLAVNGRPVMAGFSPDKEKIKGLIKNGSENNKPEACSCGGNC